MQYVIVGNGTAATSAIEAIRESDRENKITVVSDESYINYSRPLISYLLGKKVTQDELSFRDQKFYQDNKVRLILNQKVTKLDVRKRIVVLSNRRKICFDKLLLATGGTPITPPIKGRDLNGVFTFTKLDDALEIEKYIKKNMVETATVIGGGLIGLKVTEALIELRIKVTIVELADRILSATFDQRASHIIERALAKIGCRLITNNTAREIKGKDRKVKQVILKNNEEISTDLVILAIGVKPNIELVEDTPLKTNKGILVDSYMQTNIEDIYAAGDCCGPIAIWPQAAEQGRVAGYNMALRLHAGQAGGKKEYSGSLAMNSVELCGIPTISVGETNPEGPQYQILEYFNEAESVYKKLVLKNNRIVGVIFMGDIERAGIYTGLIKDGVDVRSFKHSLLKGDFGLVSLPREYRKHLVEAEAAII